ncbi:hypothetical protein D3C76_1857800 [compost metagenome]
MSKSLISLLWDLLRSKQLEMMRYPIGSPERFVLVEDAREIEKRLTGATVSAG